ncbi:Bacitracin transport ATP-binding protein BcrA [Schaedlerella arabinosiphila]|nr:Bacitracin transport ATP-binding protein BcrA [Schaedlerella arabinosiphila]
MMKHILETECVTKEFRGHSAVCGVSLQIPECCVYGLLGPNGAGKSTILKMLTGIFRPTSGKVLFDGHPWSRKDLAEIGALVETPLVYENLTAWENLKVRALILGISDARIREVLERVDLADTGKKKAGAFSLGMKQRLGLGIALLGQPRLLILDVNWGKGFGCIQRILCEK